MSTVIVSTPEEIRELVTIAVKEAVSAVHDAPKFLTMARLCDELQISPPTVRKMLREGMPFVLCGELKRYNLEGVTKWLSERGAK